MAEVNPIRTEADYAAAFARIDEPMHAAKSSPEAESFMYALSVAIGGRGCAGSDLFRRFDEISALLYEGTKGIGRLILTDPSDRSVDMLLEFVVPVPLSEPRWCRKVLQMAQPETALIADCERIFGLGTVASSDGRYASPDTVVVEFLDRCHWRLLHDDQVMLVSRHGSPSLPDAPPRHRLVDTYRNLFPEADREAVDRFIELFEAAVGQPHGNMLIVAKEAAAEASRLAGQGTRIAPTVLTPNLYHQASGMDGAVIVDPHGTCHAIGVILDGPATPDGTASRGARYNSAVRYVCSSHVARLAVVVSEDQTVDVIPVLMTGSHVQV
ncbi:MAG: diadenylate cyclase [Spirochaetaceae bacterium]|nr:diadenylate cyclase [Spirochaetaceae bacterium]